MSQNKLAETGQRVLEASHGMNSAFIQMRAKPPATTFSSKALSFYNSREEANPILIQSTEKVNFATHD